MDLPEALDVMGLDQRADRRQLRRAYRQLCLRHHPDRFQGAAEKKAAEERFLRIRDAYEFLRSRPHLLAGGAGGGGPAAAPSRGGRHPPKEFEEIVRRYRRSHGVSGSALGRWFSGLPSAGSGALAVALVFLYCLLVGFLLTWKR